MKILVTACLSLWCIVSSARSLEEDYAYAGELMEMVAGSPEWEDCLDEDSMTNEVEILFPTMDSLFVYQMPTNSYAYGWTVSERQQSFDSFLTAFSTTNAMYLSSEDENTGSLALLVCIDKKYTNSLQAAKNIIRSSSSPYAGSAIRMLLDMHAPNEEMNVLVLNMVTNHTMAASYERQLAMSSYVQTLTSGTVRTCIVTNAAAMFFQNRNTIESSVPIDILMLFSNNSYSNSIARLNYAQEILARSTVSDYEKLYFSNVTNIIGEIV